MAELGDLRWWGWGTWDRAYPADRTQRFLRHLHRSFGFPTVRTPPPPPLEAVELRPLQLEGSVLEDLGRCLPPGALHTDPLHRVTHSLGKSYRDLVRLRRGQVPNPPDAVARPSTPEQVRDLLTRAAELGVAVVPFGGGTGVVGGVEGPPDRPHVAVRTQDLGRLVSLDRISGTATFQAGILGPDLERCLREHGLTLGHFPQSFGFSTLGGWVATRSAGQSSHWSRRLENLVQAVRLELPGGTFQTSRLPAWGAGPELGRLAIGSEGALGVLSEVTVRVRPVSDAEQWCAWYLPRFPDAVGALRRMVQRGLQPALVRLSDPAETRFLAALEGRARGGLVHWLGNAVLAARARREEAALVILAFDGSSHEVEASLRRASAVMRQSGGVELGAAAAGAWAAHRFELPYLRDELLGAGVMVQSWETSATWSNLLPLHERLTRAVHEVLARGGATPAVASHLSHVYPDGASLHLTCLAPQEPGRELEQDQELREAACRAILEAGGGLAHHHGIGLDRARWLGREVGEAGLRMLRALKRELDPANVMNPGKLIGPA